VSPGGEPEVPILGGVYRKAWSALTRRPGISGSYRGPTRGWGLRGGAGAVGEIQGTNSPWKQISWKQKKARPRVRAGSGLPACLSVALSADNSRTLPRGVEIDAQAHLRLQRRLRIKDSFGIEDVADHQGITVWGRFQCWGKHSKPCPERRLSKRPRGWSFVPSMRGIAIFFGQLEQSGRFPSDLGGSWPMSRECLEGRRIAPLASPKGVSVLRSALPQGRPTNEPPTSPAIEFPCSTPNGVRRMRAALLGAGGIARVHLAALKALTNSGQDVETVAICDLSPVLAEVTAAEFGVPHWFTDHRRMLAEARPDVVHVTTPGHTHVALASDAINAGAHVLVEKPIAMDPESLKALLDLGEEKQRLVAEDHNYAFQSNVRELLSMKERGDLGEIVHVEVWMALDITGDGSRYVDLNLPHPALREPVGAVHDFLTHLAYLAHLFVGPHRSVATTWRKRKEATPLPCDEWRALVEARDGSALLGFSSHGQPDAFTLEVHGTKARAKLSFFQPLLAVESVRGGPRPLQPIRNALGIGKSFKKAAWGGLKERLAGGPASYEGLFALVEEFYSAVRSKRPSPISRATIEEVTAFVHALGSEEVRL
jgi:predicted dehydrogenase